MTSRISSSDGADARFSLRSRPRMVASPKGNVLRGKRGAAISGSSCATPRSPSPNSPRRFRAWAERLVTPQFALAVFLFTLLAASFGGLLLTRILP